MFDGFSHSLSLLPSCLFGNCMCTHTTSTVDNRKNPHLLFHTLSNTSYNNSETYFESRITTIHNTYNNKQREKKKTWNCLFVLMGRLPPSAFVWRRRVLCIRCAWLYWTARFDCVQINICYRWLCWLRFCDRSRSMLYWWFTRMVFWSKLQRGVNMRIRMSNINNNYIIEWKKHREREDREKEREEERQRDLLSPSKHANHTHDCDSRKQKHEDGSADAKVDPCGLQDIANAVC